MDNSYPCDRKLRRAFTDVGKLSTNDDRSRQFPRLFKQTSFASARLPNFNKHFKLWNNWTAPEISRANKIVVEHLKSRRHIRSWFDDGPCTGSIYSAVSSSHTNTKLFRSINEVNKTEDENLSNMLDQPNKMSSERQLILPKLEKDFILSNNYEKENCLCIRHKQNTINKNVTANNIMKNDELLASSPNKTACLRNFYCDSNSAEASGASYLNDGGTRLLEMSSEKERFQRDDCQVPSAQLPSTAQELDKNARSLKAVENYHGSNWEHRNEAMSSLCNDHAQKARINAKIYFSCDLSDLPLLGDHLSVDNICNDLNERCAKAVSINGGDISLASTLVEKQEIDKATRTGAPASLKVDFLTLPLYKIPKNCVTATGTKRKVYQGDIAWPISTNNNFFRLCVWADRDMSTECTEFHNKLFPRLRLLAKQKGVHLQIIDLHLDQSDPTGLDSFRPEMFTSVLGNCIDSGCQSRVVILLGEKYGAPILPSTLSSLEFNSLQHQLIHRLDTQERHEQQLIVPRGLRSSSQCSRGSRTDSASSSRHLKPLRNNPEMSSGSISRVATPTKSPRIPAILVNNEQLPRNTGDTRGPSCLNGDCALASGRSELGDLYRIEKREGQEIYKLKTFRFSESENKKWKIQMRPLLDVLPELETPEQEKYTHSLSHAVLASAYSVPATTAADDRFVCVVRNVANMADNLQSWAAQNYFDITADGNGIHRGLKQKMKELRNDFIKSKVPPGNLVELQMDLQEGIAPSVRQRQVSLYVNRMQEKLYDKIAAEISNVKSEPEGKVLQEVLNHVAFCQQRVRDSCLIQKTILHDIMAYVISTNPHVFILYGPDGSGKTTLISLAAIHVKFWTECFHSKSHILIRVIGCTRDSTNICDLLHGLCTQLQDIFQISAPVPTDYIGLINQFSQILSCARATEKLVIFLDGVDLLEGAPEVTLQWIPKELPTHVRLIISTRSQEKHGYLKFLKQTFTQPDVFKEILPLDKSDSEILLDALQKQIKGILSPQKELEIIDEPKTDLFPLNIVLIVTEHFSAETVLKTTNMSGFNYTTKQLITHKFDKLEQQFGRTFAQRVLGYLTTAKFGLDFNELEAVLVIDKVFVTTSHSSFQKLSPYHLLSFLAELRPYLQECVDGTCRVFCWSHRIFYEEAEERYLKNQVQTAAYHRNLATFFSSCPPASESVNPERLSDAQPLFFNNGESLTKTYFNYRKLTELPHHLVRSQQTEAFKKDVVFSFDWMQAELHAVSFANVLRVQREAESIEPQNTELSILTTALRLSEWVLKRSPDQLASQLVGRLSSLTNSRFQTSSGEALKYPNLKRLIECARHSSFPALLPLDTCLVEPGDELPFDLYAHVSTINAMDLTADGKCLLTASKDNSIKVWDMCNGRVVQSMCGLGAHVSSLISAVNNTCIVTVETGSIRVWLLSDQKCLYRFETGTDSLVVTAVSNAKNIQSALLVVICDGTNKINVWDLQDGSCRTHSVNLKGKCVHQSRSFLLARNCRSTCFLYSFRDSNGAVLQNATNGNIVYSLQSRESSSTVVGVAITSDYLVLACRQLYLKSLEIHQLELFDPGNGLYLRNVRGCIHDIVSSPLIVPSTGSNILTLSTSQQNNASNVIVWNLETESHKHLAKHQGISELLACGHMNRVLTASRGDNHIKQWDLSVKINQTSPELKAVSNIFKIIAVGTKPDCFVTLTSNNGPIDLWMIKSALNNISTTQESFLDPSDVVLVKNTKLVILSERRLPNISDDLNQVFQSILIYDMETESYEHKLSGCYIDVSPPHDYLILSGDRLLGLSSSRSHFIIWSLLTGQVVHRIKSCFKDWNWVYEMGSRTSSKRIQARECSANMTPWKQRSETVSARARRREREKDEERFRLQELRKEKENPVDGFLVSKNYQILVVSYFAHHLCIFEIEAGQHLTTVVDENAMLFLHVAAMTADGAHFVHTTYDEMNKTSYVTLRESRFGQVKRRLKNEKDVCAIALTDSADRVVMAKHTNEIHFWEPMVTNSLRKRKLPKSMKLDFHCQLFLVNDERRAVLFAGQISLWDLEHAELIATFSPENKVLCCNVISQGDYIILGVSGMTQPIVLTVKNAEIKVLTS